MSKWERELEVAIAASKRAAQMALSMQAGIIFETKSDGSPVTAADKACESIFGAMFSEAFPDDGLLGEEGTSVESRSGRRWIIDPIDGTRSFVRGIPIWATMIGLEYKGELIAGVVRVPAMKQVFHALRGAGAFRDDRRIQVSNIATLAKSHLYYSSISWFTRVGRDRQFLDLVRQTERQRGFGDFYGFMMIAQGAGEIMIEHGVHSWDLAAIVPIIEEAGGKLTAWDGVLDIDKPDVLATNGLMHEAALKVIQKAHG
jgi:histidinol-phosphatase